jgi:putative peptidoglycan lipid II flippase
MLLGIGAVAVNVVLDLLLVRPLAHGGLALATSLAAVFAMVLLLVILRRRVGALGGRAMLDGLWRISLATGAMGLAVSVSWVRLAHFCQTRGFIWNAGSLAAMMLLGALVYGIACWLLRLPELDYFIGLGRRAARRLLDAQQEGTRC